jgi:hypothetical protein
VAEDKATVLALDAKAKVPYGRFRRTLQTYNFTPLDPASIEHKFYAPGIGLVLEVNLEDEVRNELIRVTRPRGDRHHDDDGVNS